MGTITQCWRYHIIHCLIWISCLCFDTAEAQARAAGTSIGLIVGVIGGVAFAVILVIILVWACYKFRKVEDDDEDEESAEPKPFSGDHSAKNQDKLTGGSSQSTATSNGAPDTLEITNEAKQERVKRPSSLDSKQLHNDSKGSLPRSDSSSKHDRSNNKHHRNSYDNNHHNPPVSHRQPKISYNPSGPSYIEKQRQSRRHSSENQGGSVNYAYDVTPTGSISDSNSLNYDQMSSSPTTTTLDATPTSSIYDDSSGSEGIILDPSKLHSSKDSFPKRVRWNQTRDVKVIHEQPKSQPLFLINKALGRDEFSRNSKRSSGRNKGKRSSGRKAKSGHKSDPEEPKQPRKGILKDSSRTSQDSSFPSMDLPDYLPKEPEAPVLSEPFKFYDKISDAPNAWDFILKDATGATKDKMDKLPVSHGHENRAYVRSDSEIEERPRRARRVYRDSSGEFDEASDAKQARRSNSQTRQGDMEQPIGHSSPKGQGHRELSIPAETQQSPDDNSLRHGASRGDDSHRRRSRSNERNERNRHQDQERSQSTGRISSLDRRENNNNRKHDSYNEQVSMKPPTGQAPRPAPRPRASRRQQEPQQPASYASENQAFANDEAMQHSQPPTARPRGHQKQMANGKVPGGSVEPPAVMILPKSADNSPNTSMYGTQNGKYNIAFSMEDMDMIDDSDTEERPANTSPPSRAVKQDSPHNVSNASLEFSILPYRKHFSSPHSRPMYTSSPMNASFASANSQSVETEV